MLAFDSFPGCLLGTKLRPGNHCTSKKVENFFTLILQQHAELNLLVQAGLVFTKPEIYAIYEEVGGKFTIRPKANPKLQRIAKHLIHMRQPG